ncbi:hypothetical protein K7432_005211 [Basidiobolus ranarum]|uniref:Arrestin C-terminal-like domain-containing protein n=1 Tax=Basidiobolus ranarum TaxID=34480 RepID=A0ABR2W4G1_9FUNG
MFSSSSLDIVLQNNTLYPNPYNQEESSQMNLQGCVVINTSSVLKVKKIYLQFSGKLAVHFPAAIKKTRRNLAEQTIILLEQDKPTPISGQQVFPFEILLPNNLPESFRGEFGKIKYTLKAVAETTFTSSDLKSEVPVYVQRSVDTLEEPSEEYSLEKTLPNQVACKVTLPTMEYTPGEKFDIQVSAVALDPSVRVTNVTCFLNEYTYFRIPSKNDQTRLSVAEYVKRLSFSSAPFNADENTKTLLMKTPENASLSCVNTLVEISHELSLRVYVQSAEGVKNCLPIIVPINVVSFVTTPELDQLPMYHAVELPPAYTHCSDELISLPPVYCSSE